MIDPKAELQVWFEQNFNDDCGYTMFANILEYISVQGLPEEETRDMLSMLLDGIGLTENDLDMIVAKIVCGKETHSYE